MTYRSVFEVRYLVDTLVYRSCTVGSIKAKTNLLGVVCHLLKDVRQITTHFSFNDQESWKQSFIRTFSNISFVFC